MADQSGNCWGGGVDRVSEWSRSRCGGSHLYAPRSGERRVRHCGYARRTEEEMLEKAREIRKDIHPRPWMRPNRYLRETEATIAAALAAGKTRSRRSGRIEPGDGGGTLSWAWRAGAKTASRILGTAAFVSGYVAQDSPIYGAERRGAPVAAFTRVSVGSRSGERGRSPIRMSSSWRRPALLDDAGAHVLEGDDRADGPCSSTRR